MNQNKISKIYEILSTTYQTFDQTDDEWMTNGLSSTPFKSLVSVALSTMTTSKRTINACKALYPKVASFEELMNIDEAELVQLIKPVAHYNRKAKNLKKMSRQIIEDRNGEIPRTAEELMSLAGIGRKCTDIMLNFVFDEPTIAVDTHVHRLVNRLGMVNATSAEETANVLSKITPKEYKKHAHEWLIQHGMNICKARVPKCQECTLVDLCGYDRKKL
ncbi:endonuclease III [Chamaesiphon sp. OTE_8_metabat_110]|uniref:endonuclease III domain-containing protein n=1 Tax=Chamaesiphon sp. OTE_8_metabat_110 TaxID=2964696 RepID=UPI00286C85AA|nr:endonuclease III [Chamaesiphon sp. OTE_8_metabat_110]